MLKNPVVLEFLGLDEKTHYSESELESAIIDKLETFLLELGKGFLFESRQKRFTFDSDNFFVDLVFYNRILRCYVLIDLKIGKLTHENLGQMQMYVNYYNREVKLNDENPFIGTTRVRHRSSASGAGIPRDLDSPAEEGELAGFVPAVPRQNRVDRFEILEIKRLHREEISGPGDLLVSVYG
jgi:hypothetical protein